MILRWLWVLILAQENLEGLRYGKICILADADSDGLHIATLLYSKTRSSIGSGSSAAAADKVASRRCLVGRSGPARMPSRSSATVTTSTATRWRAGGERSILLDGDEDGEVSASATSPSEPALASNRDGSCGSRPGSRS